MNKINGVSRFFRMLFQALFVILPVFELVGWIKAPEPLSFVIHIFQYNVIPAGYEILHPLTITERLLGFGLGFASTAITMVLLYFLIKLFRSFENNEIFSINNVRYLRNVGYALLASQIFRPIHQGLMGFIVTMNNPHGHRFAKVSLDQTHIGILLTALMVILISWVIAEGYKLREEQLLTV